MVMVPKPGLMEENLLENGRKENSFMGHTISLMVTNILVISRMVSPKVMALAFTLMEENILGNLSVEKNVLEELVFLPGEKQLGSS